MTVAQCFGSVKLETSTRKLDMSQRRRGLQHEVGHTLIGLDPQRARYLAARRPITLINNAFASASRWALIIHRSRRQNGMCYGPWRQSRSDPGPPGSNRECGRTQEAACSSVRPSNLPPSTAAARLVTYCATAPLTPGVLFRFTAHDDHYDDQLSQAWSCAGDC